MSLRPTRGVLHAPPEDAGWRLHRSPPSDALRPFVEFVWVVEWDLRERAPITQPTLPHPCVHLVADRKRSGIFGVMRDRFDATLDGTGRVVGVKFLPGCFRPFLGGPVSKLRDQVVDTAEVFGLPTAEYEARVLDCADRADAVRAALQTVEAVVPQVDPVAANVCEWVGRLERDRSILRVEDLAEAMSLSLRTVQRLFSDYVGISPKWIIRRYRLHEAAARAEQGETIDWARVAAELGYFDQAHLIRDFTDAVGQPPARYASAQ